MRRTLFRSWQTFDSQTKRGTQKRAGDVSPPVKFLPTRPKAGRLAPAALFFAPQTERRTNLGTRTCNSSNTYRNSRKNPCSPPSLSSPQSLPVQPPISPPANATTNNLRSSSPPYGRTSPKQDRPHARRKCLT